MHVLLAGGHVRSLHELPIRSPVPYACSRVAALNELIYTSYELCYATVSTIYSPLTIISMTSRSINRPAENGAELKIFLQAGFSDRSEYPVSPDSAGANKQRNLS